MLLNTAWFDPPSTKADELLFLNEWLDSFSETCAISY